MARTEGAKNKFNPAKEAEKLTKQVEALVEGAMTPDINLGLVKTGFGLGVHTLILAAMGDEGVKGLSATNRITAAKELKDLGLKVLGDDAFKALEGRAKEEKPDTHKEDHEVEPEPPSLGLVRSFPK